MAEQSANTTFLSDGFAMSSSESLNFDVVNFPARIAVYDDFKSPPRIVRVEPQTTNEFIESLTSKIYELSHERGGKIPYTIIREVSENLIHAHFSEIVVSIFDQGNTIRFSDQGPGIADKEKAQRPGYTSAIEPMKKYIRGVGSGFPTVKEWLEISNGHLTIDDNIEHGAIVTISLMNKEEEESSSSLREIISQLKPKEQEILSLFADEKILGITDIKNRTGISVSSVSNYLNNLIKAGLVERTADRKRTTTSLGSQVAHAIKER